MGPGFSGLSYVLENFRRIVIGGFVVIALAVTWMLSAALQQEDEINAANVALQCDSDLQMARSSVRIQEARIEELTELLLRTNSLLTTAIMAREAAEEAEAECLQKAGINDQVPSIGR